MLVFVNTVLLELFQLLLILIICRRNLENWRELDNKRGKEPRAQESSSDGEEDEENEDGKERQTMKIKQGRQLRC